MTAPPVERLTPSQVKKTLLHRCAEMVADATNPRKVYLFDKNWTPESKTLIWGESSGSFVWKLNDTGEGKLRLPGSHKVRAWIVDSLREDEDLHIMVQSNYMRWTGKATTITDSFDDKGFDWIDVAFIHEFEHVKKVMAFCNPFLPAEAQWPKIYACAGPSATNILMAYFLNMARRFATIWAFSDNLFRPQDWVDNLNPANWPIIVKPINPLTDTSMWSVMASRMGNLFDMVSPTLKDAGLHLRADRWFPGDPQPAPEFYTLTRTTLVLSVDDVSGYRGLTGTAFDGLAYLTLTVADDLINETVEEISGVARPAQYSQPGYKGTLKDFPWVAWRSVQRTRGISGINSWSTTVHKASASTVVTGGKSPNWVNSGIKLLLNASLGYLGQMIGNPNLFVDLVYPQLEDVFLAFDRIHNPIRAERMGIHGPPWGEVWEPAQTGFSFSALQSVRAAFYKTRSYTSSKVEVRNAAPYLVGQHFRDGSRVAVEVGRSGWYYVDNVYSIADSWDRKSDPAYVISIGDDHLEDTPSAIFSRQIANIRAIVQTVSGS